MSHKQGSMWGGGLKLTKEMLQRWLVTKVERKQRKSGFNMWSCTPCILGFTNKTTEADQSTEAQIKHNSVVQLWRGHLGKTKPGEITCC